MLKPFNLFYFYCFFFSHSFFLVLATLVQDITKKDSNISLPLSCCLSLSNFFDFTDLLADAKDTRLFFLF